MKTAEVVTNDPREPVVQLSVSGPVERFAAISPSLVNLRGVAGEGLRQTVRIVPEEKYPFRVLSAQPRDGRGLRVRLAEAPEAGRPAYSLEVENTRSEPGAFNDIVVLRTDSPLKPELEVRVFVNLRPPAPPEKRAE